MLAVALALMIAAWLLLYSAIRDESVGSQVSRVFSR